MLSSSATTSARSSHALRVRSALAFVALSLVIALSPTAAEAMSFRDQQVRILDHTDFINDSVSVSNRSAFYFAPGAAVYSLTVFSGGWLSMSGGQIRQTLTVYGTTEAYITGGAISFGVSAYAEGGLHWSGGRIGGRIHAYSQGVVYIYGSDFAIDGTPVDPGLLAATSGTLSGTLNSGETFSLPIRHGEVSPSQFTGTIVLVDGVPNPSPPPDVSDQIVLFDDGGTHRIDHADFLDLTYGVRVRSPNGTTRLEIADGARIGRGLEFSDGSIVDITGGEIAIGPPLYQSSMLVRDATLNMSGGLYADSISVERGTLNLSGGTIGDTIWGDRATTMLMTGGTVENSARCSSYFSADPPTEFDMEGGTVMGDLTLYQGCIVRISGGSVGGSIYVGGSDVEIIGSDFAIDGVPVGYGAVAATEGTLTGTLASGDPISNDFYRSQTSYPSVLTLSAPEPAALASGFAALLALCAVRRAHR